MTSTETTRNATAETYIQMSQRHWREFNAIPRFAALTRADFEEGKRKLGIIDDGEVSPFGGGLYYRKADMPLLEALFDRQDVERKAAMQDFNFCVAMFRYELANHEFAYCIDEGEATEEVVNACRLTMEEFAESDHLQRAFETAKKKYLRY